MSHAARALTVIALMIPFSAVTGTFFSVLRQHFSGCRRTGRSGKGKHIPAVSAEPQRIPDGAWLISLNWCRSSSNEYECFAFDLNRDGNSCRLSGWFVDPESGGRTDAEAVLLDDGQLKSIEGCLKSGGFRVCGEREPEEGVYDGVSGMLCAGWSLPDGSTVPVRYRGRGEKELFRLLKLFLRQ